MSVDRKEVERIAALARLRLSSDETDRLTVEMNQILAHATRLRESARTGAPAGVGEEDPQARGTRADPSVQPDRLRSPLEAIAPEMVDGFFVVPRPPGVGVDAGSDEA